MTYRTICLTVLLICGVAAGARAQAAPEAAETLRTHLYAGRTADAVADLTRLADSDPRGVVRFALGVAHVVRGVEHLGQALHRHGLRTSVRGFMLPFFRLPVPNNPRPEPLSYGAARDIIAEFVSDLSAAEQALAGVSERVETLPLDLTRIRLDLDGNGTADDTETLWRTIEIVMMGRRTQEPAEPFVVDFDAADAVWLRGYTHLTMALGQIALAHDWEEPFTHTFHALFPRADLPFQALNDRSAHAPELSFAGEIVDFVAFAHLARGPVTEPARLRQAWQHLKNVVRLSRENWRLIAAETDNQREWLPNPRQTGVLAGMPIGDEQIRGWHAFLDEFDALLDGRTLVPHWRLRQGINLRRVFHEPTPFDLVLWIQGTAAFPYLEDGPVSSRETWRGITRLFGGDFLTYAILFN